MSGGLGGREGALIAELADNGGGIGRECARWTWLARDRVLGGVVTRLARSAGSALISWRALVFACRIEDIVGDVEAVVWLVLARGLGAARGVCAAVAEPVIAEGQLCGAGSDGALFCRKGVVLVW